MLQTKLNINLVKIIDQYIISDEQIKNNRKNLNSEYKFVFEFPKRNTQHIFDIIKLNNRFIQSYTIYQLKLIDEF